MASLGVDVVVEKLLRKSAREALEHADDITDAVVKLHLEEVADAVFIRRGRYLGQALDDIHFEKIRVFLKKFKVDLQIGPSKGSFKVEDYFYSSGKVFEMRPQNAALFITNGKTMRLVLRKNSTTYELLHELMHLRHSQKLGLSNYYSLGKQGLNGTIIRERYVFDKLMEHAKYLNKSEVIDAKNYVNWNYNQLRKTDEIGNPIPPTIVEIPFDINSIPKKRQGINIDNLFKLK